MDLDSDLQTSTFAYIYSFSRGIRFVGSQDVICESRPSLFEKKRRKCFENVDGKSPYFLINPFKGPSGGQ